MARNIEPLRVFYLKYDKVDFIERLETVVDTHTIRIYAWTLLPNHFHLLIRTGPKSLSSVMRKLMTSFAVSYNLRHKRHGHVFQNRYKSIVCEEDPYLLELVRYIHLNPLRAGLVKNLDRLNTYPWSGHSALMGSVKRLWQDTDDILRRFAGVDRKAREEYLSFVADGIKDGKRLDLMGGGLIRRVGGWSEVLSMKRKKEHMAYDDRILGSEDFVTKVLREAEEMEANTLRLQRAKIPLKDVISEVAERYGLEIEELTSGSRRHRISVARNDVAQIAVKKLGLSGAEVARRMGVSTACINRIVSKETLSDTAQDIITLWNS